MHAVLSMLPKWRYSPFDLHPFCLSRQNGGVFGGIRNTATQPGGYRASLAGYLAGFLAAQPDNTRIPTLLTGFCRDSEFTLSRAFKSRYCCRSIVGIRIHGLPSVRGSLMDFFITSMAFSIVLRGSNLDLAAIIQ